MTAEHVRALARGLLTGEAMSWPNAGYRIRMLTPRRLARMEVLAEFAREHATTTPAVPYAHSSPVQTLQPGAGEVSEWYVHAVLAFAECRSAGSAEPLAAGWRRIARNEGGASRIGTRISLENIRRGLSAPQSGNDNPHYFDDMPMVRSVAAVAVYPEEESRRAAARADASFTGARDGVWCAEATAVLFSGLVDGATAADAVGAALGCLPAQSWSRRMAEEALAVSSEVRAPLALAQRLSAEVGDWIYSYATVAPETLAFLLAHVATARTPEDLMLGVLAQPRNAATLPALAGAAGVVLFGTDWLPPQPDLEAELAGVSVADLAGTSIAVAIDGAIGR